MGEIVSLAYPATAGVNTSDELAFFDGKARGSFIKQATNLRIHNGRWRTRYAVQAVPTYGLDAEQWRKDHTQSAVWYLPQAGQGTHYIGSGLSRIVESAAGKLYTITPVGNRMKIENVSGGVTAYSHLRLAWLCVAENYVIRTDGKSQVQIWDGKNTVQRSPGYNASAKDRSRFPNAAGPTVYAGGRLWTVLFDRRIYVSDSLHQTDAVGAADILSFTDQSYDITNVYFAPPTSEGDIVALTVSVSSGFDNSRAQGEVLAMCRGPAIWGTALGIAREQWATANMRKTRSVETAATGPSAFCVRDGDILMRTSRGIESLNLLARERQDLGNAAIDLGADMKDILSRDDEESLLFCSLINPVRWSRMLCTVAPMIDGPRHSHLGWVSANWNPKGERQPTGMAWEGVSCLPAEMGRIVQFLPANIKGKTVVNAIVDKDNGTSKGIVKITQMEAHDSLEDGSAKPIQWGFTTHKLTSGGPYKSMSLATMYLYLSDMKSDVTVEIYVRDDKQRKFKLYNSYQIKVKGDGFLGCPEGADTRVNLGKPAQTLKDSRWIQFMVRGTGITSVDIGARSDSPGEPSDIPDKTCTTALAEPTCQDDPFYPARL